MLVQLDVQDRAEPSLDIQTEPGVRISGNRAVTRSGFVYLGRGYGVLSTEGLNFVVWGRLK